MTNIADIHLIHDAGSGEIWGIEIDPEVYDFDEDDLSKTKWRVFKQNGDEPTKGGTDFKKLTNHANGLAIAFFTGEALKRYLAKTYELSTQDVAKEGDPRRFGSYVYAANRKIRAAKQAA